MNPLFGMWLTMWPARRWSLQMLVAILFDRQLAGLNDERIGATEKRPCAIKYRAS
jgi:hypothetical protein